MKTLGGSLRFQTLHCLALHPEYKCGQKTINLTISLFDNTSNKLCYKNDCDAEKIEKYYVIYIRAWNILQLFHLGVKLTLKLLPPPWYLCQLYKMYPSAQFSDTKLIKQSDNKLRHLSLEFVNFRRCPFDLNFLLEWMKHLRTHFDLKRIKIFWKHDILTKNELN